MISRNKGIFSIEFLVPIIALLVSAITIHLVYVSWVTPNATDFMTKRRLLMAQGTDSEFITRRPVYIIIKDHEPEFEIIFCFWGLGVLGYKLYSLYRERRLFRYDFVRIQPGERIIPEDAIDRYKDLKSA